MYIILVNSDIALTRDSTFILHRYKMGKRPALPCTIRPALQYGNQHITECLRTKPTGSYLQSAAHFAHGKAGATFEFMERFCKWSKKASILMFISAVALFI
jgi:hypothetical protein